MKKDKMNILERMRDARIGETEAEENAWRAWIDNLSEDERIEYLEDLQSFASLLGVREEDQDPQSDKHTALRHYLIASWWTKVATGSYPLALAYKNVLGLAGESEVQK